MKFYQSGRSMVEMLGVLAIIGVLSVGAIAGYSKAMMKYRLNKQSEQLNYIISNLEMADINIARENLSSDNVKSLFSQLGIIPDEMIKDNSIYDAMNNKISINVNNSSSSQNLLMQIALSPFSMESCVNIYKVAKAHSNTMWQIALRTSTSEGYDYKNRTFGDNYCAPSTTTCIKDTDMSYIQNFCGACIEGEDCSFALFLAYQNS